MTTPNVPVVNEGLLYVNGMQMSAGALNADLLSTALINIAAGQSRDSSDVNDINLAASVSLNTAVNGANGLDTGALAATTLYAVYVIGDSTGYRATASLMSLSFTQPLLPFGYDMYRRVGTVLSNAAGTRILNFKQVGNAGGRSTWYAVPLATAVAAGASTSFAPVTLTTWVPITATEVLALSALTSDAGGTRTVVYSSDAGTTIAAAASAGMVIESSPASTVTSASLRIPVNVTALGVVSCQYAVSNGAASVAVSVQGFVDAL